MMDLFCAAEKREAALKVTLGVLREYLEFGGNFRIGFGGGVLFLILFFSFLSASLRASLRSSSILPGSPMSSVDRSRGITILENKFGKYFFLMVWLSSTLLPSVAVFLKSRFLLFLSKAFGTLSTDPGTVGISGFLVFCTCDFNSDSDGFLVLMVAQGLLFGTVEGSMTEGLAFFFITFVEVEGIKVCAGGSEVNGSFELDGGIVDVEVVVIETGDAVF